MRRIWWLFVMVLMPVLAWAEGGSTFRNSNIVFLSDIDTD
jgi:hypothetical protein